MKTDRLFVSTLAAIDGIEAPRGLQLALYSIGRMEWSVGDEVSGEEVARYIDTCTYQRFGTAEAGLWTAFHRDGACTIYFGSRGEAPVLPLFTAERIAGVTGKVCGTTRPLAAFSMAEFLLFQRTYLRDLDSVSIMIMCNRLVSLTPCMHATPFRGSTS